jgi:hypothetical protein
MIYPTDVREGQPFQVQRRAMRTLAFMVLLALLVVGPGCTCKQTVKDIAPSVKVTPNGLDFGQVKTGQTLARTLKLESVTNVAVIISSLTVEGADAAAFRVSTAPAQVDALQSTTVTITFAPTELKAYVGTLVLSSNDGERPAIRVALAGEGARPIIAVTPDCASTRQCVGSVTVTPPAIDFGAEPVQRLVELDPTRLPTVFVTNDGPVTLTVTKFAIEGADAAAFVFAGNATIPASGATYEAMAGFNAAIRFKPTSEQQASYAATLVIESDDPMSPRVTVALKGTLRANLPPVVCANLLRVVPLVDAPRDYSGAWETTVPAGGYDFRATRDLRPRELAVFSALSNSNDAATCTTDPEDGRTQVTFQWTLVQAPTGASGLTLAGANTAVVQLRPVVTGEYTLELTVKDVQQHATTVRARFSVAYKQDLVAQLQWTGAANVDLDVHLVRPSARPDAGDGFSGVFNPFAFGTAGKTSGDINGYARSSLSSVAGNDFDWGFPGLPDDPTLNFDDEGRGELLENVSLNFPENDERCALADCTYGVFVHYFKDARDYTGVSPVGCFVDGGVGCHDGEACGCTAGSTCVADSAPVGDAGFGSGKCYLAPKPVVRLFFHGSATPATVVPLDTLVPADELVVGAPCLTLHVADVSWPRRGTALPDGGPLPPVVTVPGADGGRVVAPSLARFGRREVGGSLACTPDVTGTGVPWYSRQPR